VVLLVLNLYFLPSSSEFSVNYEQQQSFSSTPSNNNNNNYNNNDDNNNNENTTFFLRHHCKMSHSMKQLNWRSSTRRRRKRIAVLTLIYNNDNQFVG
jgi:uncharacterized membrane protein YgaE (UPF0421/DUF939 family)